jgi:nucleotide-binding universal stress UspA family protein
MADVTGSTLEAIVVWQRISGYGAGAVGWAAFPPDWDPAAEARRVLTDTVEEVFGPTRPEGMIMTVREGGPARVLIEISGEARMLVVGSRGHGGFAGLLLGSVSAACAEHSSSPVLVIHGTTPPPPSSA